jgi:predicted PurR-regulated permease PerM
MAAPKIKQENGNTSDAQKIAALQNEMQQLRVLVQQQSDQLAKQQKWLQLIQFSWLTFFFVVFNLILLCVFVALFMKDKGECKSYILSLFPS